MRCWQNKKVITIPVHPALKQMRDFGVQTNNKPIKNTKQWEDQ
jgi:hypothetical protein